MVNLRIQIPILELIALKFSPPIIKLFIQRLLPSNLRILEGFLSLVLIFLFNLFLPVEVLALAITIILRV